MFNRVLLVPIELAYKIGVAEACLLASCIRHYGTDVVDAVSDLHKPETVQRLIDLKLLKEIQGNKFIINYHEIEQLLGNNQTIKDAHPTFRDPEFIQLCEQWQKVCKEKSRPKTIQYIYSLFQGKDLTDSIDALKLAVNNKYVTLIFNANTKKDISRNGGGRRTWSSGGSTNKEREDDKDHLVRRPSKL